jgi:hypothetical protein
MSPNNSVRPITAVAIFFTLVSLAWTGYSVTDLMEAGPWGLLAAVSVDGLWAVVQYLDYKGIGGRSVRSIGWLTLAAASGLLAYHGWTINPAAAAAARAPAHRRQSGMDRRHPPAPRPDRAHTRPGIGNQRRHPGLGVHRPEEGGRDPAGRRRGDRHDPGNGGGDPGPG